MKPAPSTSHPPLPPSRRPHTYRLELHPIPQLPRMVATTRPPRKITAAEIARLHAELL